MKIVFRALTFALCVLFACSPEPESDAPLAQVGEKQVTAETFERRLRHFLMLTPIDEPHVREALLQNMVDEKVLVLEAEHRGFHEQPDYEDYVQRVETDAVLEAYQNVIADTQGVARDEDLIVEFALENEKVRARHLFARTREEAERLYARLQAGTPFETLAAETLNDKQLAAAGGDLGYFALDDVDQAVKKVAAALQVSEVSPPFKSFYGYSIIKLEDRFRNPFLLETEFAKNKKRLHWEVRHQKRAEMLRQHGREVLADLNVQYEPATLNLLWNELQATRNDSLEHVAPEQPLFSRISPDLPLARMKDRQWTVKDLQARARWTSGRQRRAIRSLEALQEFITGLALRDEFLAEAKAKGLHENAAVRAIVAERAEQFLVKKMRGLAIDTVRVAEDSLRAEYERNPKQYVHPRQVNVREITVASRTEAEQLLAQVRSGADFAKLARAHSLREWSRERGGEVGYAAKGEFGQLGQAIFALPKNGLGGPYQIGEHFMIVQVLDLRAERPKTFAEAKAEIAESMLGYAKITALKKRIASWRQGYKITTDSAALSRVRWPLTKS
jgi:parvulin-like peptidyl-prolyl isomerase